MANLSPAEKISNKLWALIDEPQIVPGDHEQTIRNIHEVDVLSMEVSGETLTKCLYERHNIDVATYIVHIVENPELLAKLIANNDTFARQYWSTISCKSLEYYFAKTDFAALPADIIRTFMVMFSTNNRADDCKIWCGNKYLRQLFKDVCKREIQKIAAARQTTINAFSHKCDADIIPYNVAVLHKYHKHITRPLHVLIETIENFNRFMCDAGTWARSPIPVSMCMSFATLSIIDAHYKNDWRVGFGMEPNGNTCMVTGLASASQRIYILKEQVAPQMYPKSNVLANITRW